MNLILEGKAIPTELRKDEAELRKLLTYDDKEGESKILLNSKCVFQQISSCSKLTKVVWRVVKLDH